MLHLVRVPSASGSLPLMFPRGNTLGSIIRRSHKCPPACTTPAPAEDASRPGLLHCACRSCNATLTENIRRREKVAAENLLAVICLKLMQRAEVYGP